MGGANDPNSCDICFKQRPVEGFFIFYDIERERIRILCPLCNTKMIREHLRMMPYT